MSKVKFGLSGFEYGVVSTDDTVATTKKLPGMKSAKLEITNELVTVMADDGPYVVLSGGITETTLEIEVLDLNSEARKDFYGIETETGIEKYNKNLTPNDIACMFRTRTDDGKSIWVGLLKGKFSLPGMETETKDGAPDPKSDTTTGNFVARGDGDEGDILYIGREDNPEFELTAFKNMVFPSAG
ncbi:major tail protein [Streptococcus agalactiae LMG 14747]|uniref:Major tail protein n=1 Tax=Streptococcus agalactiae LMG 14747 TaxID=1154860 RepID=V6Z2K5_STRAG|nr:major tail protein [Streptococcus agalactiae LMG 14747]